MKQTSQAGFSAVELLITLFIGVAFIIAGYQLYSIIINDSSKARLRSVANNIAYHNLRIHSGQVGINCTSSPATSTTTPVTSQYLPSGSTLTIKLSCPYGTTSTVTKVEASVKYGSEEVTHALYATYNG